MRRYPDRAVRCGTAVMSVALVVALAGCSTAEQGEQTTATSPSAATTSDIPPLPAAVGVSPGGVTTKVDVPADATESQYGQACHAARLWMNTRQGTPAELAEAYLQELQMPGAVGPGTFDTSWTQLTPAQQAGVVMAVNGAANGECE